MVLGTSRIGSDRLQQNKLPVIQGVSRDNRGSRAADVVRFRDSLSDELGRKSGKGQEKIAIKSKGTVSPSIAETHNLDLDGNIFPVMQEIKGAAADEVPPNTLVGMPLVVKILEMKSLLCIR